MKFVFRVLATLLAVLPMLLVVIFWEHLPVHLPLHFTGNGQVDRYGSRPEWTGQLVGTLLLLVLVRGLVLKATVRKAATGKTQELALHLVTAGFVASFMSLLILQGLYNQPLYAQWQPVLVSLLASSFIYFFRPTESTLSNSRVQSSTRNQPAPISQRLHPLSRLIGIRVNLLAALLMVVARSQDRWSIAILANVLAFISVLILNLAKPQQSA